MKDHKTKSVEPAIGNQSIIHSKRNLHSDTRKDYPAYFSNEYLYNNFVQEEEINPQLVKKANSQ